jgi:hypothetical protein
MSDSSAFKIGDLVKLRSDTKVMVVAMTHDVEERPGEPDVEVVYRDNDGAISSATLPPWVLQPHEKNPKVKKP